MDIHNYGFKALQYLRDAEMSDKEARKYALSYLEDALKNSQNAKQTKDWLLEMATESERTKFKLIGRVNTSGLELMEWCDDARNFDGMCYKAEAMRTHKDGEYLKRTYSLQELPEVIDNALSWYNSVRSTHHVFNSTALHILAVDDVE